MHGASVRTRAIGLACMVSGLVVTILVYPRVGAAAALPAGAFACVVGWLLLRQQPDPGVTTAQVDAPAPNAGVEGAGTADGGGVGSPQVSLNLEVLHEFGAVQDSERARADATPASTPTPAPKRKAARRRRRRRPPI